MTNEQITKEIKETEEKLASLRKRLDNPSPQGFLCGTSEPLRTNIAGGEPALTVVALRQDGRWWIEGRTADGVCAFRYPGRDPNWRIRWAD